MMVRILVDVLLDIAWMERAAQVRTVFFTPKKERNVKKK